MVPSFPVLADLFTARSPEWLDCNYYGIDGIMTAICARLLNKRHNVDKLTSELNTVYESIKSLAVAETGRYTVDGVTIIVWNRDNCRGERRNVAGYELIVY